MNKIIADWTKALSQFEYSNDENCVCSSYSLVVLLALLANGADGKTLKELTKSLGGHKTSELNSIIRDLSESLSENGQFISSNVVCTSSDYRDKILKNYEQLIRENFDAEIFAATNDTSLTNLVNNWVNEKTLGMIPSLVDSLDDDIKAVLMNALAFNGTWLEEYSENEITEKVVFHNSDGSEGEVTMLTHDEETYVEDKRVIGFIKEYDGFNYSFMGILPKAEGPDAMKDALKHIDIQDLYTHSKWGQVITSLPEFEVTTSQDLTSLLKEEGINRAFSDEAEFGNMVSSSDLKIDTVLQKAYIKVDRKGTEAAAVTAALMRCMSALPTEDEPITITLDRPFIYAVVNNSTGIPVFMGVVNKL